MKEPTATTPITDYILQSERNLRVAKAVYSEWEAAKEEIGKDFCSRLSTTITKKLPGWNCDNWGFLTKKGGSFAFWKPEWEGQYYIHLEDGQRKESMTYGILRDENPKNPDNIKNRPHSSELLDAVRKRIDSAKQRGWYEAVMDLHEPDSDLSKPEVLWLMRKDAEFLEKVAFQLLELAELSKNIIDSLVAEYSQKKKK
jgi:hypothetical protein